MDKIQYDNYVNILHTELIPALGCTEPIALAYAAAKARDVLGTFPDHMKYHQERKGRNRSQFRRPEGDRRGGSSGGDRRKCGQCP